VSSVNLTSTIGVISDPTFYKLKKKEGKRERERKAGRKKVGRKQEKWNERDMERQTKKGTREGMRINKEKYETGMEEYINK
jgi:hypothetical protein